jgi:hypothetical protein
VDGTSVILGLYSQCHAPIANYREVVSFSRGIRLAEAYHYATLTGAVGSNTGTWAGTTTPRTAIHAEVMG